MMDWGWLEVRWDRIEQFRLKWTPWFRFDVMQRRLMELPYATWVLGGWVGAASPGGQPQESMACGAKVIGAAC